MKILLIFLLWISTELAYGHPQPHHETQDANKILETIVTLHPLNETHKIVSMPPQCPQCECEAKEELINNTTTEASDKTEKEKVKKNLIILIHHQMIDSLKYFNKDLSPLNS